MAEAVHDILGGKVQLFRRPRSSYWHCRASVGGKQHRHSTKTASLAQATPRTTYSLRHTYISMRLLEGADIYQIAKNCRTSVEMIEKFYASHIKDMIDAEAVNVRKPPKRREARPAT